jgi:hypothetical protein
MEGKTANNTETNPETNEQVMKQFKVILVGVFIVLLLFLGFFIYNLIKCYLPQWKNRRELVKEENMNSVEVRRIEIDEI